MLYLFEYRQASRGVKSVSVSVSGVRCLLATGSQDGKATAGKKKACTRSGKEKPAKPATAEEPDAAMDDYWMKSGKKEVVGKKLDDEMGAYWEKKNVAKEARKGRRVRMQPLLRKSQQLPRMMRSVANWSIEMRQR